jgi:hypothetical protein
MNFLMAPCPLYLFLAAATAYPLYHRDEIFLYGASFLCIALIRTAHAGTSTSGTAVQKFSTPVPYVPWYSL